MKKFSSPFYICYLKKKTIMSPLKFPNSVQLEYDDDLTNEFSQPE